MEAREKAIQELDKAGVSLTFSAEGQLVFTGGQNFLN